MRRMTFALALALTACHAGGLESTTTELVKSVHMAQADETGAVVFQLPGFSAEAEGVPLLQVYEASGEKLNKLYLASVPHKVDTLGVVYVETVPLGWVVVVAVRPANEGGEE